MARTVQIMMPPIPGKAFTKQLPFLNNDDGIFEPEFVEERRLGLEVKYILNVKTMFKLFKIYRSFSTK